MPGLLQSAHGLFTEPKNGLKAKRKAFKYQEAAGGSEICASMKIIKMGALERNEVMDGAYFRFGYAEERNGRIRFSAYTRSKPRTPGLRV